MPRLIDDLRTAKGWKQPWFVEPRFDSHWLRLCSTVRDIIRDPLLPVLLIDNVSEYYYSSDQEYWDLSKDFPNLAPPYERFWVESKMPTSIHSKEKGDTDVRRLVQRGRIGCLFSALDPKDVRGKDIPPQAKWILWGELWFDYGRGDGLIEGPHCSHFFAIDEHGALLGEPTVLSTADDEHTEVMRAYVTFFHPAFLAVSFMHCRNVTVVEERMPKPLAKKFRAKHGIEPTKFHTLVIEPLKQILRREGGASEKGAGLQRALHICRGHFKDYRQGAGLFGKYHQLVWQPAIVRGTGDRQVQRQIEVRAPQTP